MARLKHGLWHETVAVFVFTDARAQPRNVSFRKTTAWCEPWYTACEGKKKLRTTPGLLSSYWTSMSIVFLIWRDCSYRTICISLSGVHCQLSLRRLLLGSWIYSAQVLQQKWASSSNNNANTWSKTLPLTCGQTSRTRADYCSCIKHSQRFCLPDAFRFVNSGLGAVRRLLAGVGAGDWCRRLEEKKVEAVER